ncbi:MAG TPA: hypothetical protein VFT45_27165 [Longimicrobium sp.]|nr:hypothetical protein [Longimicrobium sp.]
MIQIGRPMKALLATAVLLLPGSAAPAAAQQPEACAPLDAHGTLPLHCADRPPQPDSAATVLLQRMLLRTAGKWKGFEGSFGIAFTVDTLGRVIRPTVRVLDVDSSTFAQRLPLTIARELHYRPAVRAGMPIPVAFEQRFAYRHPGDRGGDLSVPPLPPQVHESPDPRGSTVRVEWVPVASSPLPPLDDGRNRERQMDALAVAVADSGWDASASACIALLSGDRAVPATADETERLRAVRRVATPGECPETYNSGMVLFNEDGTPRERPPGAEADPYEVRVTRVVPWTEDWVVVGLTIYRSGGTETLRCVEHRPAANAWSTHCETTGRQVF